MDGFDTLALLTSAAGTSGDESDAARVACDLLGDYMPVSVNAAGSVIGKTPAVGRRILLDAHLDQVGFVVTSVDEKGFVKVSKVGSPDPVVLADCMVTVHGKKDIKGVITSVPPHLRSEDENEAPDITDIAIDVFMTESEAKSLISPGDRVSFDLPLKRMLGTRVTGPSLDDRCGVLAILKALELLGDKLADIPLTVVFSVCEEVGGSGAATAAYAAEADEAIIVDVTFARAPGVPAEITASLGDGALVGYAPSLNRDMSLRLSLIAEKKGIANAKEIMGGRTGTNADVVSVSRAGVKTALLSIPLRNMHTPVEVIDLADVDAAAALMSEYILSEFGGHDA